MSIETFIEKSKDFINKNKIPLLFSTSSLLFDSATTIVGLNEFGAHNEIHLPVRYMVENLGVEGGVVLASSIYLSCSLYIANYAKDKAKYVLYGLSLPHVVWGAINLNLLISHYSN